MNDIVRSMSPLFAITAAVFLVSVVWCLKERLYTAATVFAVLALLNVFWIIAAFTGSLPN